MNDASFHEVVLHNIYAWKEKLDFQLSSGRLFITFGFFLLGMLAGRLEWFEDIERSKEFFRKLWKKTGLLLIALIVVGAIFGITVNALSIDMNNSHWLRWCAGYLVDGFNSGLTIFYIASITLLMLKQKWQKRLAPLSYIGKMALTSYLTQTLFGVLLFFHFGLGLFLKTSPAMNIALCIFIFGIQIIFCKFWLQRFNYGPVEWLWRSATYFKWKTLVKK
jgi:uncharacterized protein